MSMLLPMDVMGSTQGSLKDYVGSLWALRTPLLPEVLTFLSVVIMIFGACQLCLLVFCCLRLGGFNHFSLRGPPTLQYCFNRNIRGPLYTP